MTRCRRLQSMRASTNVFLDNDVDRGSRKPIRSVQVQTSAIRLSVSPAPDWPVTAKPFAVQPRTAATAGVPAQRATKEE